MAITRSNLWVPRIVDFLSLTRPAEETTIQMLAVNQKVRVTLKEISLLERSMGKHQRPPSGEAVSQDFRLHVWGFALF